MDDLDHRILANRLQLYHVEEHSPGMVFWHPRGYALYRALEDFIRSRMKAWSFREIRTPQLVGRELWERSGHWAKFSGYMFSVDDGGRAMALKPMSCPCHVEVFNKVRRSWRDLPMRYAEFGACHRNEPSGALHGLMRTRAFVQDDAHVLCREDQVAGEVSRFVKLLGSVYRDLGFPDFKVALSTRPAVRAGDDGLWDKAERMLADAAGQNGLSPAVQPGEGAFYGPKLEFALSDRHGREWQCGTVQLDFVLPRSLGAGYVAPSGDEEVPVMIHHAVLGSMERFVGILLEHCGGRLPAWLAPDQVAVLPVGEEQSGYAQDVHDAFCEAGLRSVVLDGNETLSRRIVSARALEIPAFAVVGAREADCRTVALRQGSAQVGLPLAEAASALAAAGSPPSVRP